MRSRTLNASVVVTKAATQGGSGNELSKYAGLGTYLWRDPVNKPMVVMMRGSPWKRQGRGIVDAGVEISCDDAGGAVELVSRQGSCQVC